MAQRLPQSQELSFIILINKVYLRLSLGSRRQEPKLTQGINHGAFDAGLCTDISRVPPKQKFRDFLLSAARFIGALAARLRAVARPAALRRWLKPLWAPSAL